MRQSIRERSRIDDEYAVSLSHSSLHHYAAVGMESINPVTLRKSGALSKTGLAKADDHLLRMKEQIAFLQDLGLIVSGWFAISERKS